MFAAPLTRVFGGMVRCPQGVTAEGCERAQQPVAPEERIPMEAARSSVKQLYCIHFIVPFSWARRRWQTHARILTAGLYT